MSEFEEQMKASVKSVMFDAIADYTKVPRTEWVQKWPGQTVLNASQLHWTTEIEDGIRTMGAEGVDACHAKQLAQLRDMVVLIGGKLTPLARITLSALAVIDVHARDVTKRMCDVRVATLNDFEWISQMRYYWRGEGKGPGGNMAVMMVSSERPYGYEYLGNSLRLVITPLTDKCYLTLMGALQMILGGAPAGPAGTGKTESVKDLAKALAKYCVVFNCSDGLDYLAMGKFFKVRAGCGCVPSVGHTIAPPAAATTGPRVVWRLGLLRRVQPHRRRGALSRCAAAADAAGGCHVWHLDHHVRGLGDLRQPPIRRIHHDEPRVCRPYGASRQFEGPLPTCGNDGTRLRSQ